MEGFLQSLKHQDPERQRQICAMKGRRAKNMGSTCWRTDQTVWWKGSAIYCLPLLGRAYSGTLYRSDSVSYLYKYSAIIVFRLLLTEEFDGVDYAF